MFNTFSQSRKLSPALPCCARQKLFPTTFQVSQQKQYELTDHLGNVRTTFSDIKQAKATDHFQILNMLN
ncbi:MAG: hypothetical protein JNM36_06505 [Chitinophagales bacterium]|nr:hypothetical protein [Chitinophagales bacterium]